MTVAFKISHRPFTIGAVAGGIGAAVSFGAVTLLDSRLGGPLGLIVGASAGGAGAWLAVRAFRTRIIEALSAPVDHRGNSSAPCTPPLDHEELDALVVVITQSLESLRRHQIEGQELERLTHGSWSSIADGNPPGSSTWNAKQCVMGLLDELRETTAQLLRHTVALEEANERVASGAIDQSETVARATFNVETLSEKIDRISHNAENANEACERTRQEARRGLEQVHRVIEGMERLLLRIESSGRKARRLGDRSVEIGTIVELIRGISSRTDMLALNATIESVRAGEHGRGFAVVAEEIRKLAERTAAATGEIGTLVEAIQADAHESLRALGEEQGEMEQEVQRIRETGSALDRISKVAEQSAVLVEGISRSSNDQVHSAHEMVRAMQRISEVSHLTLEGTNQTRESIRGISICCERLQPLSSQGSLGAVPPGGDELAVGTLRQRRRRTLTAGERTP
ncbi:methyl-accepting chemotaxis protein [Singulisphaera sp. Ch08]|uniref:Methyl-accepting chemotaxis protein n=1 Tax=Singulisphaera sp. Ch08 TaxID=3120278 RepID=A0AAU7CAE5_9BACT